MFLSLNESLFRAKSGCISSVELILKLFEPTIIKLAKRYSSKSLDFEDLYQEAKLILIELINEYDEKQNIPFSAYIKTMLKKRLYTFARKQWNINKKQTLKNEISKINDIKEQDIKDVILKLTLKQALKQLDKTTKAIIKLYYYKNKTDKQIACILNTSQQNINKKRNNTLKKLKQILLN